MTEKEDVLFIKAIHVMPENRKKGTGKLLMAEAEKTARQKNIEKITLTMKP